MALAFKDEQAYTHEGADRLSEGLSRAAWHALLRERGLYKADIDRLDFRIERELSDRHATVIQDQLERHGRAGNTLGLADGVFRGMMQQQRATFRKERESRVRLLLREGATPAEIHQTVVHPLFPAAEADHIIEMENKRKEFKGQEEKETSHTSLFAGGGLLLLGSVLTLTTDRIWYGALLIGFFLLVRGIAGTLGGKD